MSIHQEDMSIALQPSEIVSELVPAMFELGTNGQYAITQIEPHSE
jgi:hypothetical protein